MPQLSEDDGMAAVGIILGCAARQHRTNVDYTETEMVRAVWPESLSADALQIGVLVAFAIMGITGADAEHLEAAAGNLMPAV